MKKKCKTCQIEKNVDTDFGKVKKTGYVNAHCKKCIAAKAKERQHRLHPDKPYAQIRDRDTEIGETQTCRECGVEKDLCKFPPATEDHSQRQKTCDECQDKRTGERNRQVKAGERVRNEATEFHHPVVNGKKQCRICDVWKVLETEYMPRNDTPHGYFHECWDCRKANSVRYGHAIFNEKLRDRYRTDQGYRLRKLHSERLYKAVIPSFAKGRNIFLEELECDVAFFREWIEHQFVPGMSWENYGPGRADWNFDHIIPLDCFDLTCGDDKKIGLFWANIQPHFQNSSKGNRIQVSETISGFSKAEAYAEMKNIDINDRLLTARQFLDSVIIEP